MLKKIIIAILTLFLLQSCINKKISQRDVFNPLKEYELSANFSFKRNFIKSSDSTKIESWYLSEPNPQLNLIYLSGNGSNIRSAIPFFNELSEQFDLNIFTFNYSGYGLSEGEPSINGILKDGETALVYLKNDIGTKNLPNIVLGYSLGGFVALNLLNDDLIDAGIILSSFTSLQELKNHLLKEALPGIIRPFLKLEIDESIYKLDNISLIQKNTKPILFIHGTSDDFIPSSMSNRLYELSPSLRKEIHFIKNADHRMVLKDMESNKQVVTEIKKFLNPN